MLFSNMNFNFSKKNALKKKKNYCLGALLCKGRQSVI